MDVTRLILVRFRLLNSDTSKFMKGLSTGTAYDIRKPVRGGKNETVIKI